MFISRSTRALDQIRVGNSMSLLVNTLELQKIFTPTSSFLLNNILHVLHISKNTNVHKFTKGTNTFLKFHPL